MKYLIIIFVFICCITCKEKEKPYDAEKRYKVVKLVLGYNIDLPYRTDYMYLRAYKALDTAYAIAKNDTLKYKIKATRDSVFEIYDFIVKNNIIEYRVKRHFDYVDLRKLEKHLLKYNLELKTLHTELYIAGNKGFEIAEKKYPNDIPKQNIYSSQVSKRLKRRIYDKYKLNEEYQIYSDLLYLIY